MVAFMLREYEKNTLFQLNLWPYFFFLSKPLYLRTVVYFKLRIRTPEGFEKMRMLNPRITEKLAWSCGGRGAPTAWSALMLGSRAPLF